MVRGGARRRGGTDLPEDRAPEPPAPPSAAAVVLAGGSSTRFGSDKLATDLDGRPLLHHAIEAVAEVCDDVVVVLAPGDGRRLPAVARRVHDPTPGEGPLAGAHAGLLAVVRAELAAIVGGDMPGLRPEVLRGMLEEAVASGADAVVLDDGGRQRPLPCVVRTWPAAEAAHALLHAGRRRLRDLITALVARPIPESAWLAWDPARSTLFDVDEVTDLDLRP